MVFVLLILSKENVLGVIKMCSNKRIAILVRNVFYPNGENLVFGGVERYTVDLCKLLQKKNCFVEVFQGADFEWEKTYEGIQFYGLIDTGNVFDTAPTLNFNFHNKIKNMNFDYIIYNGFNLCYPEIKENAIAIHHGIWWDNEMYDLCEEFYTRKEFCLSKPQKTVCVDTNGINWCRAVFPHIKNKFEFIPNYVDNSQFYFKEKSNQNVFTVLFPRRLEEARGWQIVLNIAKKLTKQYSDIVFSFVGRQTPQREQLMREEAVKNPQIQYSWKDMKEMPSVYNESDLVIIPTLWSEGTSLSCLEAMACRKPIIAGWVGGLTNLILNGFNGILLDITEEKLEKEILRLKESKEERNFLANNALYTSRYFSKDIWEQRWCGVLKEMWGI